MSRPGARPAIAAPSVGRPEPAADRWLARLLGGWALASGLVVLLIVVFLVWESWPALRAVGPLRFLTDSGWQPTGDAASGRFNLLPMLVGTLLLSLGGLALAIPAGVGSAVFCRFYAPRRLASAYRRLMELLAGLPSVVYGFWGLVTLVPLIRRIEAPGQSLLAGILILALMVLPTVALTAESALAAVPRAYLQGAAALGLGRWATVRSVALPAALSGILTGAVLAAARAVVETMAVLMVCGNRVQVPASLFDPVRALTANIALEMGYATAQHRSVLFVSGLLLIVVIALLMVAAERLGEGAHG